MKTLLMLLFCPGYLARMPKDEPGDYVAEAYSLSFAGYEWVRSSVTVSGRRAAYKRARWEALKLQIWGAVHSECAIKWRIVQPKPETV